MLYEDFHPFLPKQFEDDTAYRILPFEGHNGFNRTVDEFFSSIEGQKLQTRLNDREAAAKQKLEAAKRDQQKRLEGLEEVELLNLRRAAAIEANLDRVQETMDAVNDYLQQGMDWVDLTKIIERGKKQGNPVAEIIKLPMKLGENTITLLIAEEDEEDEAAAEAANFDYESDDDFDVDDVAEAARQTEKFLEVDVRLDLSPWANARGITTKSAPPRKKHRKPSSKPPWP